MATLLEQAKALRAEIDADTSTAKTIWSEFDGLRKSAASEGVDFTKNAEAFEKLDTKGKEYDGLKDAIAAKSAKWQRLMELAHEDTPRDEVKAADQREDQIRSLGEKFLASAEYKDGLARLRTAKDQPFGHSGTIELATRAELKTLLSSSGVAALYRNDKIPHLQMLPTAALSLLDVIPAGTTDSDTVEWQKESTWTNNAAETAEGSDAPESALAYTTATSAVQDITHFLPTTKRALADAGQAATLIDNRLINGVRTRLQSQLVSGDGSTPNLRGMVNVASILTQALSTDSRSDAVHKAITKIRVAGEGGYVPSIIGIHPNDWEDLALEKSTSGAYYYGGPTGVGAGTVWGLTPVISTVFSAGTPVVFDPNQMQLWYNGGLEVTMTDSHASYFIAKKVAVMASVRAAFGVYAAGAICTITGF
jgi:HK97 family phage major capsid protein